MSSNRLAIAIGNLEAAAADIAEWNRVWLLDAAALSVRWDTLFRSFASPRQTGGEE